MSVNNPEILKDIEQKINEYFSDPKNVEDFKKYLDEEMKKPYMTQLQCNCIWCKYNMPKDPDMGTITWCKKYRNSQKDLCNKECGKREWYEMSSPEIEEEN